MPGVAAGSAILMGALALFLAGLRRMRRSARNRTPTLEGAYITLLVVLAGCVVVMRAA